MDWCLYAGCYIFAINTYVWLKWYEVFQSRNNLYDHVIGSLEPDEAAKVIEELDAHLDRHTKHANTMTIRGAVLIFTLWRLS